MKKRTTLRAAWGLPLVAAPALAALLAALPAGAYANPKMDSWKQVPGASKLGGSLLDGISASKSLGKSLKETLAAYPIEKTSQGIVVELVLETSDPSILKSVRKVGTPVLTSVLNLKRMTVEVQTEQQLTDLAAIPGIRMIRPLGQVVSSNGSVTGFGAEAHFADLYAGLPADLSRGSGARIGILSDSFASTDGVFDDGAVSGNKTLLLGASATVTTPVLQPGDYTLTIQSATSGAYRIVEFATVTGTPATNTNAAASSICGKYTIPLSEAIQAEEGFVSKTIDENPDGFDPSPLACNPSQVDPAYAFVSFRVTSPSSYRIAAGLADGEAEPFILGVQTGCGSNVASTIVCQDASLVGVLTNSLPQRSGDLPQVVSILRDLPFGAGSDEGAGMAELVYDIAPGADLFFHTGAGGPAVFADGILRMASVEDYPEALTNGCQIIVDDLRYPFGEPHYQVGLVSAAASLAVTSENVSYFSSAGNDGNKAIRQVYTDVSGSDDEALIPTGNDLHRWPTGTGFLPVTVPPATGFQLVLHWNQPWESLSDPLTGNVDGTENPLPLAAEIDLDLYVTLTPNQAGLDEAISPQAVSESRLGRTPQGTTGGPAGDAIEIAGYYNGSTENKTVYVAIEHFTGSQGDIPQIAGVPLEFTLLFVRTSDDVRIAGVNDPAYPSFSGNAIYAHGINPDVFAIGAVNYFDSPRFGTSNFETAEIDPESFSSIGGDYGIFFTSRGYPQQVRSFKPDFAAVDGNNTTFFGGSDFDLDGLPNFFGTSAAAPNAAAIAALLKSQKSDLTPAQIRAIFESTSIDVLGSRAGAGRDSVSGSGLIKADAALQFAAENFGVDGGLPSPTDVSFFNFAGGGGWSFESISQYTAAGSSSAGGGITLTATNNTNTFGYWKSPAFTISESIIPGFQTIQGRDGDGSLFRVTYRVSSSTDDASKTPDFRMRASSGNFEQTSELVISSVGTGLASPRAGDPRFYRQYFNQPANQARFNLYFDLIAFRSPIEVGSSLTVSEVSVEALSEDVLLDSRLERLTLFSGTNTQGWTAGSATEAYAALGNNVGSGLFLGPATDATSINFSFWNSPAASPVVTLQRNRLYRVTYRVTSTAAPNAKLDIPTFRLRANDTSNSLAALIQIDPMSDSAVVPFAGTSVNYKMYFETPEALIGRGLTLAFDQLFVPGTGANPSSQVKLESVRIDSYTAPPQ